MRKYLSTLAIGMILILLFLGLRATYVQASDEYESASGDANGSVFTLPAGAEEDWAQGAPQSEGGSYLGNPLPPIPDDKSKEPFASGVDAAQLPNAGEGECYEYIANPSFEGNGNWYGQPSANVGFEAGSWFSGARSVFLNTNYYSNAALWQTIRVPNGLESAGLAFYSAVAFADPGETVYIAIYDETFSELIFWDYLVYTRTGVWKNFADGLPVERLAGRTIQLTFQLAQDYDAAYTQILFDDVSLVLCHAGNSAPPTATPAPTSTPTATRAAATPTATGRPTLLPTNTPTATPAAPPVGGSADLKIAGIQVGQTLMADVDPVTGISVPLIAGKPALARVYVDVSGVDSVENLDAALFVRDAGGQVHTVKSLNGPIQLIGDSSEGSPGSTLNFLLDIAWLNGQINIWAEIDPDNRIAETNENNNRSVEIARTFQPSKKLRIAWVEANAGVDRGLAQISDVDMRKLYPVGVNDLEYFFQPGFNQPIGAPLTTQNFRDYFNALNRFWDRMTHEGNWVGGAPPDRLYGWTAGQPSGLCGVADAIWAGGRGRVATGYAQGCGAETLAHELGHIFDNQGLRHSPNRPREQDPRCISQPGGPELQYPNYPNLPLGSIGVVGFDASRLEILYPNQTYDFMSYCAPEWISPFNYTRMLNGFAPTAAVAAARTEEVTAKLLVSGLVYAGTDKVDLDPFYVIRSDVAADASSGSDYCVELRDEADGVLESRCFDLGFIDIESGQPTDVDGFSLVVPYPQATTKVVLVHKGKELANRSVTANQPFVRLTNPVVGAVLSGDEVEVTWNGADLDGDNLHYSLAYSSDAGASWLPLAADLTATSVTVDLTTLPGSSKVQFRVGASDGINTAYDTSDSLEIGFVGDTTMTVSGKAPTAAIRTQATRVDAGSAIVLEGTGYDLEDGLLPEENLRWWSNRDGELGSGSWLRSTLSSGQHTLTLTATDKDGNTDTAAKTLFVGSGQTIFLPLVVR